MAQKCMICSGLQKETVMIYSFRGTEWPDTFTITTANFCLTDMAKLNTITLQM